MDRFEAVELFTQIDAALDQEEFVRAARLIVANFDALADPAPLRERTAQILAANGYEDRAVEVYQTVGLHYANSGQPARAIAVAARIDRLDRDPAGLLDRFTALYNVDSPFLDPGQTHGTFQPPIDQLVTDPKSTDMPSDLMGVAAERALESGFLAREPSEYLPPLPLLSQLPSEHLEKVLEALEFRTFSDLVPVVDPETSGGELIWTVTDDLTLGEQDPEFRLLPGTLLGMSAYGPSSSAPDEPVFARSGSEILSLPARAVAELSETIPDFADHLARLARRAFIEGLLSEHPMFASVSEQGREQLLEEFEGLHLSEGTRVVRQDTESPGLFLILDGEVDVVRQDEDWEITVETLGPGSVFGEVGLVSDQPTQANVVTTRPGHLLHIPDDDFDDVAAEHPGLAKYAVNLAQQRMADMETTLSASDLAELSD
jgi:CRP-like cAMP-binding protein